MEKLIHLPIDPEYIFRKKRALKRKLLERSGLTPKRIAILGGSTTSEIVELLELFLLDAGIKPTFYQSQYNRYYEDIMFGDSELEALDPDISHFEFFLGKPPIIKYEISFFLVKYVVNLSKIVFP